MAIDAARVVAELRELRALTGDEHGAQRVAWTTTWLKAREWFERYPKAAYMTEIESWRELPDDRIEFVMRRLPSAD